MKKFLPYILILIILSGIFGIAVRVQAQVNCTYDPDKNTPNNAPCKDPEGNIINESGAAISTKADTSYHLLAPLPGCTGTKEQGCEDGKLVAFNPGGAGKLGEYLNFAIRLFIGLCAVAAVVMIVIGGIEYATSELISSKSAAKERIQGAIFGLILALGAYTILFTINPDLLNTDVDVGSGTLTSQGEFTIADLKTKIITPGGPIIQSSIGTTCDYREIVKAAEQSGHPVTEIQATTMSCIASMESSGCKPVKNFNWNSGSSANGPFQVLIQSHSQLFENPVCYAAAGVSSGPLGCRQRSNLCIKASNNFACSSSVAAQLVLKQPDYRDWLVTQKPCRNAACIRQYSPQLPAPKNVPQVNMAGTVIGTIPNIYEYCNIR